MKERPILFSAPMVRALLDGTKTQTRRAVKYPAPDGKSGWHPTATGWNFLPGGSDRPVCPYGRIGDQLWVREAWAPKAIDPECTTVAYRATDDECNGPWKPSIHMPRWASRILLEVTGVRVERLLDISESDAIAEGVEPLTHPGAVFRPAASAYSDLWEQINGTGSWAANPWVWVVEFKVVKP
jgi:hypothetical protein